MTTSKDITRELKKSMFVFLKEHGFSKFTGRSAWRITDRVIHVVNVQSFSSSVAYGVGCTTYSFGVNLGIHPVDQEAIAGTLPQEWQCEVRKQLHKGVAQAGMFTPYGDRSDIDRLEIWYVLEDGSNSSQMIDDACQQVSNAMDWFNQA